MERIGTWIMTFTGKHFYLLDPRANEVDRLDIAHALSNINRYTGHTKYSYSVGTHSILCAEQARKDGMTARIQLLLLLHDATEAYIGDVSRPLKKLLGNIYTDMEDAIHKCVWEHFNIPEPTEEEWRTVKHYDDFLLGCEIPQLMPNPEEFQVDITYNGVHIPRYKNYQTENKFLQVLEQLLVEYEVEKYEMTRC